MASDPTFPPPVQLDSLVNDLKTDRITSFRGKGLDGYIKDAVRRRKYLPISPSRAHAESNSITLHLSDRAQLEKNSWVNAANGLVADWRILRPFTVNRKESVYLTDASLRALLQYIVDRDFGSVSPSAAAAILSVVVSGEPRQGLGSGVSLPTPPPSPAPHRGGLPTYPSAAGGSTVVEHFPRPARVEVPTVYSYATNTYTAAASPVRAPRPSPVTAPLIWPQPQSYLTSSSPPRIPGSFPQPTYAQNDHRPLYTARHHYHHTRAREPLLPTTTRTRTTTRAPAFSSYTQYSGSCWLAFLVVVTLLLLGYAIYLYSNLEPLMS
ncbi:hypothetical protein AYL99_02912 [Fonsecaea erecta]|uniref:Uncharacterized protein n=1 Tax=Fonsecaea erecta TaxID=1367422 RepID=A0A178ZXG3_9EURO|nr:hypothetical protein AYL99_02912 [Fonsecaea erecta]OAP63685.1 hypothetical protein AYL99_02912 [Fonsecaea erecta]